MSIDKQRVAAVAKLEAMGLRWDGVQWSGHEPSPSSQRLIAALMAEHLPARVEALAGATEDSAEEQELAHLTDVLALFDKVWGMDAGDVP